MSKDYHIARPEKGENLLKAINDYTVLDLETTGLDPDFDSIIEIGALRVRDGQIVDRFDVLINPGFALPEFITTLTGITDSDLADAPDIKTALPRAREFIGNDIVVAHNAHFDVNFIYDQSVDLGLPAFGNDFIDTMRMARRLYPELAHHALSDLADYLGITGGAMHRAENDIVYTHQIYESMKAHCAEVGIDLDTLAKPHYLRTSTITSEKVDFDTDHPLYGQVVVFTGALERMPRREAAQIVADCGGINGNTVTKKTNYLVLGNTDYCASLHGEKSSKHKKAEQYQAEGLPIRIISENVFYDMIEG